MPGFFTQYGVCYVQYVIPLAYSFRALHRQHRHAQRILYLKFWVLNALAAGVFMVVKSALGWFPFFTHATFCAWVWLVMPRVIAAIYNEFDRELQAFGLLPPVEANLSIETTHTARAFTYIASVVPKASDTDTGKQAPEPSITGDGEEGGSKDSKNDMDEKESTLVSIEKDIKMKKMISDEQPAAKTTADETTSSVGGEKEKEKVENESCTSTRRSTRRQKA